MKIVYDAKLKRPGCVLLQALGGTVSSEVMHRFPTNSWLLAPTPDMKVYEVNEKQLEILIEIAEEQDARNNGRTKRA